MKHRIVATLSVSAAMLIPALASANNTWHTANTEIGYTTAPVSYTHLTLPTKRIV